MKLDDIGNWVKNSPKVIALVAIGSFVGFAFTILNGFFSILTNIEEVKRKPRVEISSMYSAKKYAPSNMGQILGSGQNYTIEGELKIEEYESNFFPFVHLKIRFLNPSKNPTTFFNCKIKGTFFDAKTFDVVKTLESDGYVEVQSHLKGNRETGNTSFFLRPGEAKEIDLMFFFIPLPEVIDIWENEKIGLDLNKLSANCTNEFNEIFVAKRSHNK